MKYVDQLRSISIIIGGLGSRLYQAAAYGGPRLMTCPQLPDQPAEELVFSDVSTGPGTMCSM